MSIWDSIESMQKLFTAVGVVAAVCGLGLIPIRLRVETLRRRADALAATTVASRIFASRGMPRDTEDLVRQVAEEVDRQTSMLRSRGVSEEEIAKAVDPIKRQALPNLKGEIINVVPPPPPNPDKIA